MKLWGLELRCQTAKNRYHFEERALISVAKYQGKWNYRFRGYAGVLQNMSETERAITTGLEVARAVKIKNPQCWCHPEKFLTAAYIFLNSTYMIKRNELVTMRAIAICFKPYLKPEEALIYCNLVHTQFGKKCEEFGIYKREDLDKMLAGEVLKRNTAGTLKRGVRTP